MTDRLKDPLLVFNAQRPPIESQMTLATQKLHAQVDCPRWSHPLLEPFGMLGHHFWRLQGGMPSSIMLCQQRNVGSSLLPNSCANTAKLKWNVSEYSTTAAALEQAVQVRRPWWEVFERFACVTFLRIWVESTGPRSCMITRTRSKVGKASLFRARIETLWVVT